MADYPIFLKLKDQHCVVIGAGQVAIRKAQVLLAVSAKVLVVSEDVSEQLAKQWQGMEVKLVKSRYSKNYLKDALLVIAATDDNKLNKQIYDDCRQMNILCNVVDEPQLCDFFVPAVMQRGDLQVAISTNGDCPAYSSHLRRKLEDIFTDEHAEFLTELKFIRNKIIEKVLDIKKRKDLLEELVKDESFDYFVQNGSEKWRGYANKTIEKII